jgi:hypothetical protein
MSPRVGVASRFLYGVGGKKGRHLKIAYASQDVYAISPS